MKRDEGTEHILIVDDEAANLKLLEKMLKGQGYGSLSLVQDSREVIASYREVQPDLVLLDINMPHVDGYQVIEQLNGLDDPLLPPIVVLTAQHNREHLLKALSLGARDFITKPFDRNELLVRVRNLLEAHRSHRLLHDQKALLEEAVQERTRELHSTRLQVVQRLGRAAEFRDEETGNHILRMSHISALLAKAIGWSEARCDLILNASPMHDIGKIGIPDAILLKPGQLDAGEWEIMKSHTVIGARLLDGDDSELLRMARDIALSHHEKWDGTGYPHGLSGEDIPQAARIAALADVFDALTSERPYKVAWTIEASVELIRSRSGTHFDPALVGALMEQLPAVMEIRERFSDQRAD
jgi:putative two-component system response regulator